MSQPVQLELLSDDDDDDNTNKALITPVSNHFKRPRTESQPNSIPLLIIDDDPTPQKCRRSVSSTPSFVPETPFSDMPKPLPPPIFRCTTKDVPNPSSGSVPKLSGVGGLICLESDDEAEECLERGKQWNNLRTFAGLDEGENMEKSPEFDAKTKQWENGETSSEFVVENCLGKSSRIIDSSSYLDKVVQFSAHDEAAEGSEKGSWSKNGGSFSDFDVGKDLEMSPKYVVTKKLWGNGTSYADFDVECLESPEIVQSTSYGGNLNFTKMHDSIHLEDDIDPILSFHDPDHGKENVRLEEEDIICKPKSRGQAKTQKKWDKDEQAANRKKSQEEKARLKAEKKLKKEQGKLDKEALKAEAAKSRQLQKDKQRWEKEAEKNILAEVDAKVIELGSIGGPLITRFGEKGLRFSITSNPIQRSIVWRMTVPEEISQLSSITTDIPYVLLIYDAAEFCKVALDGSIMDHISSVRTNYPSYTICCLTNRLASYINKRDQDKYKNRNNASDWQRPPVEEVLAKFTTHFANMHSRQCADEAELAEHVAGLTVNLAKCRFRKKLTPLSVNANGCNVPKDCMNRDLIMKSPWLKALIAIPKVQPRFAIAISKKYPTMKSLLSVYMDPTKSVHEKEFLLKDLTMEGLLGNEDRRLGEICSKRVYRVLMAQNGSIKTDDVETGADYFTAK